MHAPLTIHINELTLASQVFESVGTAAFFWESKAVFRKRNVKYSVTAYPSVRLPHP